MDLLEFNMLTQHAAVCIFTIITITFAFFGGSLGIGLLAMIFLPAKYVNPELIVKVGTVLGFFIACSLSLYFLVHPPSPSDVQDEPSIVIHVPPDDDPSFGTTAGRSAHLESSIVERTIISIPGVRVIGPVNGALRSDCQPPQNTMENHHVKQP